MKTWKLKSFIILLAFINVNFSSIQGMSPESGDEPPFDLSDEPMFNSPEPSPASTPAPTMAPNETEQPPIDVPNKIAPIQPVMPELAERPAIKPSEPSPMIMPISATSKGSSVMPNPTDALASEMPKAPSAAITKPSVDLVPKGLDTTDIGNQGNWLLTRVWYEQAEEAFGKLLQSLDSIIQAQIRLFKEITESEKSFDSVFKKANFDLDEIEEELPILLNALKDKPEKEAVIVRETREILTENKAELEKLSEEIKKYRELETSSNDVVNQVISQVNRARNYQKDGWNDLKQISDTLNDDKAKELYYKIEGYLSTMEKINTYLSGKGANTLSMFLSNLTDQAVKNGRDIVTLVDQLSKKELHLKNAAEIIKNAEKYLVEEEQQEAKRSADAKKAKQKKSQAEGWFASIINWFKSWFA